MSCSTTSTPFEIDSNGCLTSVPFYSSPHYNERPDHLPISLLVIHCISLPEGEFGLPHIHHLFMGTLQTECDERFASLEGLRVSAHLFIDRMGSVTQYVPFHKRAWHAGVSEFQGRPQCNDFSIGIELEGTDRSEYTDAQYRILKPIVRILQHHYPDITSDRIVGHEHIAPNRKTDPGEKFDWSRIKN